MFFWECGLTRRKKRLDLQMESFQYLAYLSRYCELLEALADILEEQFNFRLMGLFAKNPKKSCLAATTMGVISYRLHLLESFLKGLKIFHSQ